ncbi:hypothetical protein SAMN05421636_102471 [Pricia antarctica]|uniref:Uncharacterized protein n=1 Tax=Pricia antarctica TaxID=641691 RepID=A0A1G6Z2X4_9FLAO|nr:hypothetical protein [Pricia antarctica]SDD97009.1 hypothetical protein SAMN05421636_102471 [Pricia antarctica]
MSGHIFDMVNRIAQNKISRRKKFKGDNRDPMHDAEIDVETEYVFPKVSVPKMERIKLRIQREAKAENRKSLFYFILSLMFAALLVWIIVTFYDLNKYPLY